MGELVFAALTPHPPLLIPEIGGREREHVKGTVSAMEKLASALRQTEADTLVIMSPHGPIFRDAVGMVSGGSLVGDFDQFGLPDLRFDFEEDVEFSLLLRQGLEKEGIPVRLANNQSTGVSSLDYASLVPLYYLNRTGDLKVVSFGTGLLPFETLQRFGQVVARMAVASRRRVGILASGDLSHRLSPDGPAGYHPDGARFDQRVLHLLKGRRWDEVVDLDETLVRNAGECGLRPIIVLVGAIRANCVKARVHSYEGPFGVGYAVVEFKLESAVVSLARRAITEYVCSRRIIEPEFAEGYLSEKRAAFVSLKREGRLRGCIGTILPTQQNLAGEVVRNAILAATEDPRFAPVGPDELDALTISVDVLGCPEAVQDTKELNPKRYGVIVRRGSRVGLLLPDLEGIESVENQLAIAKRKAGIGPREEVTIERFTVTRYH